MWPVSVVFLWSGRGLWGPSYQIEDWYTGERSLGVCVSLSLKWLTILFCENANPCITLSYIVCNLLLCVWITGVQTKLPTTGAAVGTLETRPAEQSIEGLISTSQEPPPSPPTDWSQPEIEDDDRCVTVVTHLLLQDSHEGIKQMLSAQCCRNVKQRMCAVRVD